MTSKAQSAMINSSNGFKKRLLKPVSNRPSEPTNLMKNSRILNLRDSLSVKNKYAQVKSLILSLADEVESQFDKILQQVNDHGNSSFSKGFEYVKSQALRLKQRKQQMFKSITLNNDSLVKSNTIKLQLTEKSVSRILSQLQTENLQDGLKLLYNEHSEITQIVQNLCGVMSMVSLINIDWIKNSGNVNKFNDFDGDEQNLECFVKLLGKKLKQEIEQPEQISSREMPQNSSQPKFKPIFTAKDQQTDNQQKQKLKQQIESLKKTIKILQTQLQHLQSHPKPKLSTSLQKTHKQIQQIYDQAIKLRNNQIQKLRTQLIEAQQIITKQSTINDLMGEAQRKTIKGGVHFGDLSQNADSREFSSTVQEQFEKMRTGFMKKLDKLQVEFSDREQKMKKQIFTLQKSVEGLQWEKKLILKKYEFLLSEEENNQK